MNTIEKNNESDVGHQMDIPAAEINDRLAIHSHYHDRIVYVAARKSLTDDWHRVSADDYVEAVKSLCSTKGCPCNSEVRLLSECPMAVVSNSGTIIEVIFEDNSWKKIVQRTKR